MTIAFIALLISTIVLLEYLSWRLLQQLRAAKQQKKEITTKFAGIIDLQREISTARGQLEQVNRDRQAFELETGMQRKKAEEERQEALAQQDQLKKNVNLLEEN